MEESVVIKFPTMEEYYCCDEKKNDKDPKLLTDSEIAAAAAQQLSDEENHSYNDNITNDLQNDHHDEEVDQRLKIIRLRRTWSKIEEIFGKEEEEQEGVDDDHHDHVHVHHHHQHQRPRKKRKYRSLASVYRQTQPSDDVNRKMNNKVMIIKKKT